MIEKIKNMFKCKHKKFENIKGYGCRCKRCGKSKSQCK